MPSLTYLLDLIRNYRLDADDVVTQLNPPTPIIHVVPKIETPVKDTTAVDLERLVTPNSLNSIELTAKKHDWKFSNIWSWANPKCLKSEIGTHEEKEKICETKKKNKEKGRKDDKEQPPEKGVCLMAESPFRILKVSAV
ncbi:hypothetical protein WA026_020372 [Henosepilachna vigintioctopunctata]|uniref:Uncharacterized protein n=1 Tax=Henosepilachna vigintioctopunctata TaxID=420089 RepID=A0AAW1UF03_9CUCU